MASFLNTPFTRKLTEPKKQPVPKFHRINWLTKLLHLTNRRDTISGSPPVPTSAKANRRRLSHRLLTFEVPKRISSIKNAVNFEQKQAQEWKRWKFYKSTWIFKNFQQYSGQHSNFWKRRIYFNDLKRKTDFLKNIFDIFLVPAKIASFDDKFTATYKEDVKLPCLAVGVPAPEVVWKFRDVKLQLNDRLRQLSEGSLFIKEVDRADAGEYSCYVENSFGHDTVTHQLIVHGKKTNGFSETSFYHSIRFEQANSLESLDSLSTWLESYSNTS